MIFNSIICLVTIIGLSFVNTNYTPAIHDRFYQGVDKDFIGQQYDWSGAGRGVNGSRWATLITEHFFATANHAKPALGSELIFWDNNTTNTFTTKIVWLRKFEYDHSIGMVYPPPPDNYKRYPLQNKQNYSDWWAIETFLYVGQRAAPDSGGFAVGTRRTPTTIGGSLFTLLTYFMSGNDINYCVGVGGDSGGPSFLPVGNQLVFVGTHYGQTLENFYSQNMELVNTQISLAPSNNTERVKVFIYTPSLLNIVE